MRADSPRADTFRVGVTYLLGIVVAALSWRPDLRFPVLARWDVRGRTATCIVTLAATALVATYALQSGLLDTAVAEQAQPAWQRALPYALFVQGPVHTGARLAVRVELLTIGQSLLLCAVYVGLSRLRRPREVAIAIAVTIFGAALMAAIALGARLAGPDLYANVAFGVTAHPYDPIGDALPRPDAAIARIGEYPLVPSPYGPAWNALARVLAACSASLANQVLAFRVAGVAAMIVSIGALAAMRRTTLAALFALDPLLWQFYVAEAHNDIVGIALVLTAFALRRRTVVAIALVALAGTVKLPFVVLGSVVFALGSTWRARLVPAAVAAALAIAASLAFGGVPYALALHRTVLLYAGTSSALANAAHVVLALIGLGSLAFALAASRFGWGVPWSFVAFGQFATPWYLGWGIPYASTSETRGAVYLAALPISGYLTTLLFDDTTFFDVTRVLLLAGLLFAAIVAVDRRSPAAYGTR